MQNNRTIGNNHFNAREKNMNIYVILKDGVVVTSLGTFSTEQLAEDAMYRFVTKEIQKTEVSFHEALRHYSVEKKD